MFDQAQFEKALAIPRLQPPIPEFLPGNRGGGKVRVLTEADLNATTKQWFVDYERKIQYYAEHGIDVGWTLEWAKKLTSSTAKQPSAPFGRIVDYHGHQDYRKGKRITANEGEHACSW